MKAKELKEWVNQLQDDEDIYITAMDDKFFQDFECHSIYTDGQAQELILGVYINDYTVEEEPDSLTYTIIIKDWTTEHDFDGLIADLQDKDWVQNVEVLETYEDSIRLQVVTDGNITFETLCEIEYDWHVNVELVD